MKSLTKIPNIKNLGDLRKVMGMGLSGKTPIKLDDVSCVFLCETKFQETPAIVVIRKYREGICRSLYTLTEEGYFHQADCDGDIEKDRILWEETK